MMLANELVMTVTFKASVIVFFKAIERVYCHHNIVQFCVSGIVENVVASSVSQSVESLFDGPNCHVVLSQAPATTCIVMKQCCGRCVNL